ncbi:hypothetical protein [Arthrobacter sp. B10-11]|uniref:hypothetical protein n=1 Tax=Arthrobacter sp. B10-11 TaxID=3081160 RepID=UPI0029552ECA|nr:hypothetical protein [Arthrobacter sp. B10-11]MDV8149415.1 hypothetical protein [Arthrobacter sp. B10-11]
MSNPQEPNQPDEPDAGGERRRRRQPPPVPPYDPSGPQTPPPHYGSPGHKTPDEHGAPGEQGIPGQQPIPHYGEPEYGQPRHGQPQPGDPREGQPEDVTPQTGTPQYESSQPAHPQYGSSPYGAPQYTDPGPYGVPGQHPPAKSRKKLWIILGIVGGVLLLAIVGVALLVNLVGGATSKAKGLAEDFTQLVIAGDTDTAYDDFLDPALQDKLSKEEFAAGVQSLELDETCKPTYNDFKVSSDNGNNAADVAGVINCEGKDVDLAYRFDGNKDMKMINIKLRPKA